MENTTSPITAGPTNKKLLVFTGLLILGTIFWLWSITYRDSHHMMNDGSMMRNDAPATVDVTDLDNEINSSMNSDSEIELRGIDEEFSN